MEPEEDWYYKGGKSFKKREKKRINSSESYFSV